MTLFPHSPEWYDRLAGMQKGYWYPWKSRLGKWNGEDEYLALVEEHLGPEVNVLEVACGHGEVAQQIAPLCRSVVAYDRIASWIENAQTAAETGGITNVTYLCHDSSLAANHGQAKLPGAEKSYDLLLSRRGPFHWVEDARRVARPGATLIMLVPDARSLPVWNELVPEPLRWTYQPDDPNWARKTISARLAKGGLEIQSWWSFDVPEYFSEPEQFYQMLSWGYAESEVPAYDEVAPVLGQIFADHAGGDGLEVRHVRHLWKAVVAS